MNKTRFLVLGNMRTGTSNIAGSLNTHPDLVVVNEIFHRENNKNFTAINRTEMLKRLYGIENFDAEDYPGPVPFDRAITENQNLEPFVETVYEKYNGFKLLYYQLRPEYQIWDYFRRKHDIKVIHLHRKNWLDIVLSWGLARQNDVWQRTKLTPNFTDVPIILNFQELQRLFCIFEQREIFFMDVFKDSPTLNLAFEEFNDWTSLMSKIQTFLGIRVVELPMVAFKRTKGRAAQLVVNYQSLRKQFAKTRWSRFFERKIY